MGFVKILVSLMILFVAVNLILTIYGLLNKKWREGLENASTTSTKLSTIPATHGTQATVSAKSAHKSKMHCPNGCGAPTGLSGNCNSLKKDADGNYYKSCPYELLVQVVNMTNNVLIVGHSKLPAYGIKWATI